MKDGANQDRSLPGQITTMFLIGAAFEPSLFVISHPMKQGLEDFGAAWNFFEKEVAFGLRVCYLRKLIWNS